jgi:hypothetical protein
MPEVYVQKTGWELLKDVFGGAKERAVEKTAPIVEEVRQAVAKLTLAYNPLSLSVGDLVLFDLDDANELRFAVERIRLMKRTIGRVVIYTTDYVLFDPTGDSKLAIRAFEGNDGKPVLCLLFGDGDNGYNEALENMLNATAEGGPFPREEASYAGYVRPSGAPVSHEAEVTDYSSDPTESYKKTYWDFERSVSEGDPMYFFEMDGRDGFFYAYTGRPVEQKLIRAFRF